MAKYQEKNITKYAIAVIVRGRGRFDVTTRVRKRQIGRNQSSVVVGTLGSHLGCARNILAELNDVTLQMPSVEQRRPCSGAQNV